MRSMLRTTQRRFGRYSVRKTAAAAAAVAAVVAVAAAAVVSDGRGRTVGRRFVPVGGGEKFEYATLFGIF